jgi:hypothetical protein
MKPESSRKIEDLKDYGRGYTAGRKRQVALESREQRALKDREFFRAIVVGVASSLYSGGNAGWKLKGRDVASLSDMATVVNDIANAVHATTKYGPKL